MVEERLKYLRTHYKMVEPCPPQVLLKEVSWIAGDEAVASFLLDKANLVNFNSGETIITHGSSPEAIFILVSGLVKLTYIPSEETMKNLRLYGALPNVDYFTTLQFHEKQEDYIVSGNVVGELGVLTGRPYDVTISCDTSVQSWPQEKIKFHLERAFVPTLTGYHVFSVNDLTEDVLLIEGQVMDANSRFIFYAPTYIPRTVQKILFPKCSLMNVETPIESKLLIIPAKDVDEYDVMETAELAEMISTASSKCLKHTVQSRTSAARSYPSRKFKGHGKKRNIFGYSTSRNRHDMESRTGLKLPFVTFVGSKVFPAIQSDLSYPRSMEKLNQYQGHAPERAADQVNTWSGPVATTSTKEEGKSSPPVDTSASKHENEKNISEVHVEEKKSEKNLMEDPIKKAPMADLTEEEEEEHEYSSRKK